MPNDSSEIQSIFFDLYWKAFLALLSLCLLEPFDTKRVNRGLCHENVDSFINTRGLWQAVKMNIFFLLKF